MINYELKWYKRKSLVLSISKELKVVVKAPINMSSKYIEKFVDININWIEKHKRLISKKI